MSAAAPRMFFHRWKPAAADVLSVGKLQPGKGLESQRTGALAPAKPGVLPDD